MREELLPPASSSAKTSKNQVESNKIVWHLTSCLLLSPRILTQGLPLRITAIVKEVLKDFPGGPLVTNQPANAGDMVSIPGPGGLHMPWGN